MLVGMNRAIWRLLTWTGRTGALGVIHSPGQGGGTRKRLPVPNPPPTGPSPFQDPHSLPSLKGIPRRPRGEGDPYLLFFLQFSFQRKWNNSPGPRSPPSPPLPAFPAAPEPASCLCSSLGAFPGPAACRGGAGEEGARIAPPAHPQFPCLPGRACDGGGEEAGALSIPEPDLPPRQTSGLGPGCCLQDWGGAPGLGGYRQETMA